MSSKPNFLYVLKDPYDDSLTSLVVRSLAELDIEPRLFDSTNDFIEANGFDQSHILVISGEWTLMLGDCAGWSKKPSLLIVGSSSEPYESRHFPIDNPRQDEPIFPKHVMAWLNET